MKTPNFIWLGVIVLSIVGSFYLFDMAYANPSNLPDYAFIKPEIKEAYLFAKTNYNDLVDLPCGCGCGTPQGAEAHGSRVHELGLADCFMQGDVNDGGKWDSHASSCGLCFEDALYAKKLYQEGNNKKEIKKLLEEKNSKLKFSAETVY